MVVLHMYTYYIHTSLFFLKIQRTLFSWQWYLLFMMEKRLLFSGTGKQRQWVLN